MQFGNIVNISIRAFTLLSKFSLIFVLAHFLKPSEVGVFGLFSAATGYMLYVLGFEFYTYSNRALMGAEQSTWLALIRDQSLFFILNYFFLIPLILLLCFWGFIPWDDAGYFFIITILEHIAQELNRLLTVMSKPFTASCVLFFRSGIWCIALIILMMIYPESRSLSYVLRFWLIGVLGACLMGIHSLLSLEKAALSRQINWVWIKNGVKVALPFLVASLAIRGVLTFDRYIFEAAVGLDNLAPYVLFMGVSSAIMAFIDSGVIVFAFPKILSAADPINPLLFDKLMRTLFQEIIVYTLCFIGLAFIFIPYILSFLSPLYSEHLYLLKWILLATFFYAVSMAPHMGLYALKRDKSIIWSQVSAFLFFMLVAPWAVNYWGIVALTWTLCATFFLILLWKSIQYQILKPGFSTAGGQKNYA